MRVDAVLNCETWTHQHEKEGGKKSPLAAQSEIIVDKKKELSRLTFGKTSKKRTQARDHKNWVRVCVKAYLINKVIKIMCLRAKK